MGKLGLPTLGTRVNLIYPVVMLGSRKERTGHREHATYSIALESSMTNTGSFLMDDKGGGK